MANDRVDVINIKLGWGAGERLRSVFNQATDTEALLKCVQAYLIFEKDGLKILRGDDGDFNLFVPEGTFSVDAIGEYTLCAARETPETAILHHILNWVGTAEDFNEHSRKYVVTVSPPTPVTPLTYSLIS